MKKPEFILSSEIKCRNPRFLLIFTLWGEMGKVILQVSIAVFSCAVENFFGQSWLSPPRKIGPYAYVHLMQKTFRSMTAVANQSADGLWKDWLTMVLMLTTCVCRVCASAAVTRLQNLTAVGPSSSNTDANVFIHCTQPAMSIHW